MSNSSAAVLVGRRSELSREIWSGFVASGLVEFVLNFSSVDELLEGIGSPAKSVDVDIRLIFFVTEHIDDLSIPIELGVNKALRTAPLVAFYSPEAELTSTDIETLYDRGVNSVLRLPIRFPDLGRLVLRVDNYWSASQRPYCKLPLPNENIFLPDEAP